MKRFLLIDADLRSAAGHTMEYARVVIRQAAAAGYSCEVAGCADGDFSDLPDVASVRAWFEPAQPSARGRSRLAPFLQQTIGDEAHAYWTRLQPAIRPRRHASAEIALIKEAVRFAKQVEALLEDFSPAGHDRIFLPNLRWWEVIALFDNQAARTRLEACETFILLRFDPPTGAIGKQELTRVASALKVSWLTDTEELASAYSHMTGVRFARVSIPFEADELRSIAASRQPGSRFRVAVPGEARREKGFHLLPDIVEAVQRADPHIHFSIQIPRLPETAEASIVRAAHRLQDMNEAGISVLPVNLPADKFREFIGLSDILLLPYTAGAYKLRSSGLLLQGLAAGLNIVTSNQRSWLTGAIESNNALEQVWFSRHNPAAYAAAIVKVAEGLRSKPRPQPRAVIEESLGTPWAD